MTVTKGFALEPISRRALDHHPINSPRNRLPTPHGGGNLENRWLSTKMRRSTTTGCTRQTLSTCIILSVCRGTYWERELITLDFYKAKNKRVCLLRSIHSVGGIKATAVSRFPQWFVSTPRQRCPTTQTVAKQTKRTSCHSQFMGLNHRENILTSFDRVVLFFSSHTSHLNLTTTIPTANAYFNY